MARLGWGVWGERDAPSLGLMHAPRQVRQVGNRVHVLHASPVVLAVVAARAGAAAAVPAEVGLAAAAGVAHRGPGGAPRGTGGRRHIDPPAAGHQAGGEGGVAAEVQVHVRRQHVPAAAALLHRLRTCPPMHPSLIDIPCILYEIRASLTPPRWCLPATLRPSQFNPA